MNLGPAEIIVILLVALVVFGPRKLPELGRSLGAGIREFKRGTSGLKEELEQSLRDDPKPAPSQPQTVVAQAVVPPVTVGTETESTPQR